MGAFSDASRFTPSPRRSSEGKSRLGGSVHHRVGKRHGHRGVSLHLKAAPAKRATRSCSWATGRGRAAACLLEGRETVRSTLPGARVAARIERSTRCRPQRRGENHAVAGGFTRPPDDVNVVTRGRRAGRAEAPRHAELGWRCTCRSTWSGSNCERAGRPPYLLERVDERGGAACT